MNLPKKAHGCVGRSASDIVTMAAVFTLATTFGWAGTPAKETIHATYTEAGNSISITLLVYDYSTASDLLVLSQAFQQGHDRELATALSKTKAVGRCVIAGGPSYDVAFIQMVSTPTGRQIVFVTSRPHPLAESDSAATPPSLDLALGQFDLNDANPAMSTGFLFPASKLVADEQGLFHYDLAGTPWTLVDVLASNIAPPLTAPGVTEPTGLALGKTLSTPISH